MLHALSIRHQSSVLFWIWSPTGACFICARVCSLTETESRFHRCTTSCLLCYLSSAYPKYATVFQFLISLDFSSHYMHMYRCEADFRATSAHANPSFSSLVTGSRSHKLVTSDVSRILSMYYNPVSQHYARPTHTLTHLPDDALCLLRWE